MYDEMDKRVNMKAVPQVQGINMWCSASICQKCQEHIILERVFTYKRVSDELSVHQSCQRIEFLMSHNI